MNHCPDATNIEIINFRAPLNYYYNINKLYKKPLSLASPFTLLSN